LNDNIYECPRSSKFTEHAKQSLEARAFSSPIFVGIVAWSIIPAIRGNCISNPEAIKRRLA